MQSFQDVIDLIQPEQVGRCWFRGQSPQPQGRIFGGQVLAQCLLAANATVEGPLLAHSMHAYFLRGGDPTIPIEFDVDPIRDGRSFATRRVVARQNGAAIFNTSISYQITEAGFTHSQPIPNVPLPEDLDESMRVSKYPAFSDMYQIERVRVTQRSSKPQEKQQNWFKVRGDLVSDARIHQAGLALITDCALLGTSFYPQGLEDWDINHVVASLDHAIWFHEVPDITDFILYECDSPWAGNARGFNRGQLWNRDGKLLASTAQEALVRPKTR